MNKADGLPDTVLIEQFAHGDVSAFEMLVARYEKPIFNFVRRSIGPSEDVEDITQETFLRVYERIHDLRNAALFRSWLWAIAVNLCRDRVKRLRYRSHLSIEDALHSFHEPASSVSIDRQFEDAEIRSIVDEAIGALRLDVRMVVVLRE